MRVIAGKFKRRELRAPLGSDTTRPSSDRLKESLFNILGQDFEGCQVLDLFSGSGALGIESISRGATRAVLVEADRKALEALRGNLESLKIPSDVAVVVGRDVEGFLLNPRSCVASLPPKGFDIIFADPPYASPWYESALAALGASDVVGEGTLLVLEMSADRGELTPPPKSFKGKWCFDEARTYGKSRLEFWKWESLEEGTSSEAP